MMFKCSNTFHVTRCYSSPLLSSLTVSVPLILWLLVVSSPGPAVFSHLVLLPVPGRFRGEITTLEPAGERPGVVVESSVISQFVSSEETFPTDVAGVFLEILSSVLGHQVVLKLETDQLRQFFIFLGKVWTCPFWWEGVFPVTT